MLFDFKFLQFRYQRSISPVMWGGLIRYVAT